jgi:dienelactone hydrolase
MSDGEHFDIVLSGRKLRGTAYWPSRESGKLLPATLICISPDGLPSEAGLTEALATALTEAGVAAVVYHAGPSRPSVGGDPTLWKHAVDDAAAVFRWVALHDKVDLGHLALIGYGRGAVVASCLSRRSDQIAGVCLIAPSATYAAPPNSDDEANRNGTAALHPIEDAAHFDRPTLVLIAGGDEIIPFPHSQAYLNAMENVEHQVRHLIVARADHGFADERLRQLCVAQVVDFLRSLPAVVHAEPHL